MSCFDCRFYTGEDYLACGVDPITAATSPEEGCRDWQPIPNPWGFWEWLIQPPHVDHIQIGCVPINGWELIVCDYVPVQVPVWYEPYRRRTDSDGVPGIVVTRNEFELGYARAVSIPELDLNVYEGDFVDNEFDDD